MREVIASDGYAATFPDLASYRQALLTVFDGSSLDLNCHALVPKNSVMDPRDPIDPISETNLKRLEKYALAATPGPWEVDGESDPELVASVHAYTTTYGHDYAVVPRLIQDKLFIAEANPATVLAMVERIRKLQSIVDAIGSSASAEIGEGT